MVYVIVLFLLHVGTNKGVDGCYQNNMNGNVFGNCGHDFVQDTYITCASENIMCGVLYCQEGQFNNVDNIATSVVTVSGRDENGMFQRCSGSVTAATSDALNPGLVDDGTKCGDDRV